MKAWQLIRGALLGAALAASVVGHTAAPRANALIEAAPIRAAAALLPAAGEARVLVLGELHGTQEVPALAGEVVRRRIEAGVPTTLALEIHVAEQARIDAYLASNGDASARAALLDGEFWRAPPERSDGRRSVAMLALLDVTRELRNAGGDLRVLTIDAGNAGRGADERNVRMAARLREAIEASPGRSFVVLVGNYHARKAAPTRISSGLPPGGTPPVPTMAHLADLPMLRVNVSAESGTFWACMAGGCGPRTVGGP